MSFALLGLYILFVGEMTKLIIERMSANQDAFGHRVVRMTQADYTLLFVSWAGVFILTIERFI